MPIFSNQFMAAEQKPHQKKVPPSDGDPAAKFDPFDETGFDILHSLFSPDIERASQEVRTQVPKVQDDIVDTSASQEKEVVEQVTVEDDDTDPDQPEQQETVRQVSKAEDQEEQARSGVIISEAEPQEQIQVDTISKTTETILREKEDEERDTVLVVTELSPRVTEVAAASLQSSEFLEEESVVEGVYEELDATETVQEPAIVEPQPLSQASVQALVPSVVDIEKKPPTDFELRAQEYQTRLSRLDELETEQERLRLIGEATAFFITAISNQRSSEQQARILEHEQLEVYDRARDAIRTVRDQVLKPSEGYWKDMLVEDMKSAFDTSAKAIELNFGVENTREVTVREDVKRLVRSLNQTWAGYGKQAPEQATELQGVEIDGLLKLFGNDRDLMLELHAGEQTETIAALQRKSEAGAEETFSQILTTGLLNLNFLPNQSRGKENQSGQLSETVLSLYQINPVFVSKLLANFKSQLISTKVPDRQALAEYSTTYVDTEMGLIQHQLQTLKKEDIDTPEAKTLSLAIQIEFSRVLSYLMDYGVSATQSEEQLNSCMKSVAETIKAAFGQGNLKLAMGLIEGYLKIVGPTVEETTRREHTLPPKKNTKTKNLKENPIGESDSTQKIINPRVALRHGFSQIVAEMLPSMLGQVVMTQDEELLKFSQALFDQTVVFLFNADLSELDLLEDPKHIREALIVTIQKVFSQSTVCGMELAISANKQLQRAVDQGELKHEPVRSFLADHVEVICGSQREDQDETGLIKKTLLDGKVPQVQRAELVTEALTGTIDLTIKAGLALSAEQTFQVAECAKNTGLLLLKASKTAGIGQQFFDSYQQSVEDAYQRGEQPSILYLGVLDTTLEVADLVKHPGYKNYPEYPLVVDTQAKSLLRFGFDARVPTKSYEQVERVGPAFGELVEIIENTKGQDEAIQYLKQGGQKMVQLFQGRALGLVRSLDKSYYKALGQTLSSYTKEEGGDSDLDWLKDLAVIPQSLYYINRNLQTESSEVVHQLYQMGTAQYEHYLSDYKKETIPSLNLYSSLTEQVLGVMEEIVQVLPAVEKLILEGDLNNRRLQFSKLLTEETKTFRRFLRNLRGSLKNPLNILGKRR